MAPTQTAPITAISTATGGLIAGFSTTLTNMQVSGTLSDVLTGGQTVEVSSDNSTWNTASVSGLTWTYDDSGTTHAGSFYYSTRVVDSDGNAGAGQSQYIAILYAPGPTYGPRMSAIIANVRALANESTPNMALDSQIVVFCNMALNTLCRDGYFREETPLDTESGEGIYSLEEEIADLVDVYSVTYAPTPTTAYSLRALSSYQAYRKLVDREAILGESDPRYFWFDGSDLMIWPVPQTSVTGGLSVYHSYQEPPMAGFNGSVPSPDPSNPPTPAAFDDFYTFFALHFFFARDFTSPDSQRMGTFWLQKAMLVLDDLNQEGASPVMGIVPYR